MTFPDAFIAFRHGLLKKFVERTEKAKNFEGPIVIQNNTTAYDLIRPRGKPGRHF